MRELYEYGFKRSKSLDILKKAVKEWLEEAEKDFGKDSSEYNSGRLNTLGDITDLVQQLENSERFDYIHSQK